jgi:hypothetical protein
MPNHVRVAFAYAGYGVAGGARPARVRIAHAGIGRTQHHLAVGDIQIGVDEINFFADTLAEEVVWLRVCIVLDALVLHNHAFRGAAHRKERWAPVFDAVVPVAGITDPVADLGSQRLGVVVGFHHGLDRALVLALGAHHARTRLRATARGVEETGGAVIITGFATISARCILVRVLCAHIAQRGASHILELTACAGSTGLGT